MMCKLCAFLYAERCDYSKVESSKVGSSSMGSCLSVSMDEHRNYSTVSQLQSQTGVSETDRGHKGSMAEQGMGWRSRPERRFLDETSTSNRDGQFCSVSILFEDPRFSAVMEVIVVNCFALLFCFGFVRG